MKKNVLSALLAALALGTLLPAEALAGAQQERMKRCSQEARDKTLKGDERKQFMSGCLRGKHESAASEGAAGAAAPVQNVASKTEAPAPRADTAKRKVCNQSATEQSLTGAKRKTFMTECMSS
ncbi:MAG: PsiF repeat-containing protein [Thauera sp.]|nr:PsiF repeat-containing protein [Thauera sp.]